MLMESRDRCIGKAPDESDVSISTRAWGTRPLVVILAALSSLLLACVLSGSFFLSSDRTALADTSRGAQESKATKTPQESQGSREPLVRLGRYERLAPDYVAASLDLEDVERYQGDPYVELSDGVPGFTTEDALGTDGSVAVFELYSPLDDLGRVGVAEACLGPENAPTRKRGDISDVLPTGWHDDEYVFVEGERLFNRCHLIARSLSAEDANPYNLATGTSYMNRKGMLPFEVAVTDYITQTGNHVLYRASPVFVGEELVCRGVQLEALSVEDDGEGISFNVFCYNVQPAVTIDYATGDNKYTPLLPESDEEPQDYVINAKSRKVHLPDCSGAATIREDYRIEMESTPSALEAMGYEPCGQCKPW